MSCFTPQVFPVLTATQIFNPRSLLWSQSQTNTFLSWAQPITCPESLLLFPASSWLSEMLLWMRQPWGVEESPPCKTNFEKGVGGRNRMGENQANTFSYSSWRTAQGNIILTMYLVAHYKIMAGVVVCLSALFTILLCLTLLSFLFDG